MTEKTQKEMIQEIHQTTIQQRTVLLGVPGTDDKGLVGEVKDVKLKVNSVARSHGKLKRNFWLLVGALAGSGAIGGGIWSLLNGG